MFARDGELCFPGDNSWSNLVRPTVLGREAFATHRGRAEIEAFMQRYVSTGMQMVVEDVLVNGPPWRMRAAARVHHWVPGADGTDAYSNRAMLVVETRWGRIRRQEDYEDTVRVLEFDRALDDDDRIVTGTTLACAPETVWEALTARRPDWWPELEFEPVPGSPLVETWTEDGRAMSATGRVLTIDAPRSLSFEWTEPGWTGSAVVRITVRSAGRSTRVTVEETGLTAASGDAGLGREHVAGWTAHLGRLAGAVSATTDAEYGRRGDDAS